MQTQHNEPSITEAIDGRKIFETIKSIGWNLKTQFDETGRSWVSIHKILSKFEKPFDEVAVATRCIEKAKPGDKYYGMVLEEVLALWKSKANTSMGRGSDLDTYIQSSLMYKPKPIFDDEALLFKCRLFDDFKTNFIEKSNMTFIGSELWLSSERFGIRGRLDALFIHNGELVIFDWKNTEEMKTNSFEKMLGPCDFLYKSDMAKYTLQLYLYKYILQEEYKIPVKSVRVIQFSSKQTTVHKPLFEYDKEFMESCINYALESK